MESPAYLHRYRHKKHTSMKKILFTLCLLSAFAKGQSSKSILNSEIKDVNVYQAGAQVNRIVKADIEAGVTRLLVEGLSASIDKNSISVSGIGDAVLLSVEHGINYLNAEKKSREQVRLEDSLESTQASLERVNVTEAVFNDEQALLLANKNVGGANTGLDRAKLEEVANLFRSRLSEIRLKMIDVRRDQKKIRERITVLQQQLNEINARRQQPTSTITITVSAKNPGSLRLEMSYYVSGAGWTPRYDIRAKDIHSPVQLSYKADVFQRTGEEWDKVKLKLSTGNPSQSGTRPVLLPWYLDFNVYYRQEYLNKTRGSRAPEAPAGVELNSVVIKSENSELEDASNYTVVSENQLSTDFDIALPYSISPDGKVQTVDIQNFSIPATFSYFAAPKLDKDAFLVGKITGWEDFNLLQGKATVYFEGAYVGESIIDPRNTRDTLDLSFGRDKKIIVTREKKKDLSSQKFIGNNVVKELTYLITVRNTRKEPVKITIEEQVPVSKNNDITVKTEEYSGGEYNVETGKITWNMEVAPGTSTERKLGFSVKYPKDKIINGL